MKLLVAGCSFSDFCQVRKPYGEILASKLNIEYIHEGAGSGSNWRIWRKVTKYILDGIITPDDLILIQYTERTRNEFCSVIMRDDVHFGPSSFDIVAITDRFDKDYSVIRYKPGAATWQNTPQERLFFSQYEKYFVIPEFADEQFQVHNLMFQSMLARLKMKVIFISSRRNPFMSDDKFLPEFLPYVFRDPIYDITPYNLSPNDFSHMSQEGHKVFADWLYTHINNTNILKREL